MSLFYAIAGKYKPGKASIQWKIGRAWLSTPRKNGKVILVGESIGSTFDISDSSFKRPFPKYSSFESIRYSNCTDSVLIFVDGPKSKTAKNIDDRLARIFGILATSVRHCSDISLKRFGLDHQRHSYCELQ